MRIAFLIQGMHFGGVERWALSLAAGFTKIETAAFVVTGTTRHPRMIAEARDQAPVIEFQTLREGTKVSLLLRDAQDKMDELRGVDAILASGTGRLDALTNWLPCAKILVSHVTPEWDGQRGLIASDEPSATHLVAPSLAAAACFTRKATILPNGADLARIAPTIGRQAQRRAWGLPADCKIALYVGRFHPIKRADRLLEALHHLPPPWRVVFAGCSGSDEEQKRMIHIALTEHPGRVVFVPEDPHIGDALNAADCLVLTSVSEACPLVLLEAMLAKLPIVSTDYPYIRELEAKHGMLVETVLQDAHPQEMAQAIEDTTQNYCRVLEARDVAWREYTAPAMVARWEKYLLETIGRWQSKSWRKRQTRPLGKSPIVESWPPARNSGKLKVCFVSAYPQQFGGVEEWFEMLVRDSRESIDWSISVHRYDCDKLSLDYLQRLRLLGCPHSVDSIEAARGADVAIVWGVPHARRLLAGFPGATVLVSHGTSEWSRRWVTPMELIVDRCAAVSRNAAVVFRFPEHVELLPNGVNRQRATPRIEREKFRAMYGIRPADIAVGYVGRLSVEKNPLVAAQAVAHLGQPYRAVYFGADSRSGDYPQQIKQLCPSALIQPPYRQVGDVLAALDCLVLASHQEGFSLVTTEAMYVGCPVVTTPVGAILDLEREYGQLSIPLPMNPTPAQAAAGVLAALRPERKSFVARACQVVSEHYTDADMSRRWVEFLQDVARPLEVLA